MKSTLFWGHKNQRCYAFTAVGITDFGKRVFFFARVLEEPSSSCLRRFLSLLPPARHYRLRAKDSDCGAARAMSLRPAMESGMPDYGVESQGVGLQVANAEGCL